MAVCSPEVKEQAIKEYLSGGKSYREVSKFYGIKQATLANWIYKIKHLSDEDRQETHTSPLPLVASQGNNVRLANLSDIAFVETRTDLRRFISENFGQAAAEHYIEGLSNDVMVKGYKALSKGDAFHQHLKEMGLIEFSTMPKFIKDSIDWSLVLRQWEEKNMGVSVVELGVGRFVVIIDSVVGRMATSIT